MTTEQARFKVGEAALESLAAKSPDKAIIVMGAVLRQLNAPEFKDAREAFKASQQAITPEDKARTFSDLLAAYKDGAMNYVTIGGNRGARYARYDEMFVHAYDRRDEKKHDQ